MSREKKIQKQTIPYTEKEKLFHFAAIVASSDDAIVSKTLQGIITSWNKAAEKIFGYTAEEAIGQSITIIIPPERLHEEHMILDKIRQGEPIEHFDTIRVRKDGREINISVTISPIKNSTGEIIGASKIARDITQQKQVENQLQFMANVLENVRDSVIVTDLNGKIIYWNEGAHIIFGYTADEMIGKTPNILYPDIDQEQFANDLKQILKGKDYVGQWRGKRKDGATVWVDIKTTLMKNTQGQPTGFIGIAKDITDRKEAEDKIRESEAKFRQLFDSNIIGVFISEFNGTFLEANDALLEIIGYTREDLHQRKIHRDNLTLPEQTYLSNQAVHDLEEKGASSTYEKIYIRKDGTQVPVLIAVTRIDDGDTAIGFVLDISEQKKAQRELRKSQEQYKLVFEHATDLITVVDPYCRYIFASPSHFPVLGYTPEELIGINAFDLIHPDDLSIAKKEFAKALNGNIGNATYRFKHKSGKWLIIESTGSAIFNEKKEPTMVVITSHDVTERTELEQRKDEFISIASHELKTPVTSIKVFTQLLQRYNQKEGDMKTVRYLGKMEQQIDKLTKLIADLLDISKIQAGKLTFHKESFLMQKLITETIEIMQTTTDKHTILLDGSVRGNIDGDRDRISQVLINLISNAIKYSPNADKVVVHASQADKSMTIGVQDFGIGIPQEYQDKIFDRFFRVSGESEKTYPGFGIGLYISSAIINRHNGKLWVESKKGKGSTFYFSLPVK